MSKQGQKISGNLNTIDTFAGAYDNHISENNGGSFNRFAKVNCGQHLTGGTVNESGNTGCIRQEYIRVTIFSIKSNRGAPGIVAGGNLPNLLAGLLIQCNQNAAVSRRGPPDGVDDQAINIGVFLAQQRCALNTACDIIIADAFAFILP